MGIRYRPAAPRPTKRDVSDLTDRRIGLYCRVSKDQDGTEKSVDDQERDGRAWVERQGATVAEVYRDSHRSASRYATKAREDFQRLMADIRSGALDVVWFWELSRSQRRLDVFAELRDLSRATGVLWVVKDRIYDPSAYADMMTLGLLSVIGEGESEITADRVRRGLDSNAAAGRPHAWTAYGYRRIYHPETRQLVRQEPDVLTKSSRLDDPSFVEDSPAFIVREIFARIAAGHSINSITKDLNARRIPPPGASRGRGSKAWYSATVLYIARSHTYLGRRVHQGEVLEGVEAVWPGLVDPETFWVVQRVLTAADRPKRRPARAQHLLSFVARCGVCGGWLQLLSAQKIEKGKSVVRAPRYSCKPNQCVGVVEADLDAYVEKVMVQWLSDPKVFAELTSTDNSTAAAEARAAAEQLRADLAEWQRLAEEGEVSAGAFARVEQDRLRRIQEAEELAQSSCLPPILLGNVGPEASSRWDALSIEIKRQIISAVADIRVNRLRPEQRTNGRTRCPAGERVTWAWLIGSPE